MVIGTQGKKIPFSTFPHNQNFKKFLEEKHFPQLFMQGWLSNCMIFLKHPSLEHEKQEGGKNELSGNVPFNSASVL